MTDLQQEYKAEEIVEEEANFEETQQAEENIPKIEGIEGNKALDPELELDDAGEVRLL